MKFILAMRKVLIAVMLLAAGSVSAQKDAKKEGLQAITRQSVQAQLEFLASDWTEGREAGTAGNYLAGDYLASQFKMFGLKAAGEQATWHPNRYQKLLGAKSELYDSYFQSFTAIECADAKSHKLAWKRGNKETGFQYKTDFDVMPVTQNVKLTAPVVFVGYGFESKALNYNGFKNVDVAGKIVVRFAGLPGDADKASVAAKKILESNIEMSSREKNRQAIERGALAIVEFDPRRNVQDKWAESGNTRFNGAMLESDVAPASFYDKKLRLPTDKHYPAMISVSEQVVEAMGLDVDVLVEKAAKLENISKALDSKMKLDLRTRTRAVGLRNILASIEGKNPEKVIVVGAHYDHLGKYNGKIFNGADDNGSGVVAVTSIARAFMRSGVQPENTIVFALWDGEERGLLGSRYFIDHFEKIGKTVLYLNFDMVGRNGSPDAPGNKVSMIYTKAADYLVSTSKKQIKDFDLNLDVRYSAVDSPTGGSDNSGFAKKEIPIFWFHTGGHTDYHKASDHVELINWEKLVDIIKLSYLDIWEFANQK